jgi:hypothetical protein
MTGKGEHVTDTEFWIADKILGCTTLEPRRG